jgi:hypothetical protein
MEVEFDIFDADDADAYEEALQKVREEGSKKEDGETMGDVIRRQCDAVFNFFDDLFDDDFHKQLFGEKTNLVECIEAFRDFVKAVEGQKSQLVGLMAEVKADAPQVAPNRAARRAARHAKT